MEVNATELQKKFGENLRRIRKQKGMTQLELAANANLEKPNISRMENGKTNISLKMAYILSKGLDIKMMELFDFE